MTIRRVLSVVLSALVLMASMFTVTAADFSSSNIDIEVRVYNVIVTVKSDVGGTMTAQLMNKNQDTLYGMSVNSAPVLSNGVYQYTFNFTFGSDVDTGKYIVRVGNNVTPAPKEFNYVKFDEKVKFYDGYNETVINEETGLPEIVHHNGLKDLDADAIKQYFIDNETYVPIAPEDLAAYKDLPTNVLALVNAEIASLGEDLNTGITAEDILDESKAEQNEAALSAVDELFTNTFNAAMQVAKIAAVSEANWPALSEEAIGDGLFDGHYYDEESEDESILNMLLEEADVYSLFMSESADVAVLDMDEYADAFDRATLLLIESSRGAGSLASAFAYYEGEGLFTLDADTAADISALKNAEMEIDLWKAVQEEENADFDTFMDNVEKHAGELSEKIPSGGTVITPGPGTSPSGTPTIDKPTTPGASTGIVKPNTGKENETSSPVASSPFTDLEGADWAKEAIDYLASKGIINGKTANEYVPNDPVTREEITKIVTVAFGLVENSAGCDFKDISADRWSYSYIASANRLGIVNGYGDDFGPTHQTTREDMAVIIYRVLNLVGIEVSGTPINFTDNGSVSGYAKEAVSTLTSAGIINGMGDNTFSPKTYVTRAQIAKVTYELLKLAGGDQ